jgi:cyclopropane fatty-acyl-phospholipid synthase-like methyltransferase
MTNWNEVWKGRKATHEGLEYIDLLKLNGYDGNQSNLNPTNLTVAQDLYAKEIGLERGDDIYEIACGAGAFLYRWSALGHSVGGCDISEGLLECAKDAFPRGQWDLAEAETFSVGRRWDHVVSFGLCMYISTETLKNMIGRMVMKAKRSISIYDIPDLAKKDGCEEERRQLIPGYDEKYQGLGHHYHSKEELTQYIESFGLSCKIWDQKIDGYENAKWRFNLVVTI